MMLDILMDYCYLRNFKFSRLDGSMSYSEREENVSRCTHPLSLLTTLLLPVTLGCNFAQYLAFNRQKTSLLKTNILAAALISANQIYCSNETCLEPLSWGMPRMMGAHVLCYPDVKYVIYLDCGRS